MPLMRVMLPFPDGPGWVLLNCAGHQTLITTADVKPGSRAGRLRTVTGGRLDVVISAAPPEDLGRLLATHSVGEIWRLNASGTAARLRRELESVGPLPARLKTALDTQDAMESAAAARLDGLARAVGARLITGAGPFRLPAHLGLRVEFHAAAAATASLLPPPEEPLLPFDRTQGIPEDQARDDRFAEYHASPNAWRRIEEDWLKPGMLRLQSLAANEPSTAALTLTALDGGPGVLIAAALPAVPLATMRLWIALADIGIDGLHALNHPDATLLPVPGTLTEIDALRRRFGYRVLVPDVPEQAPADAAPDAWRRFRDNLTRIDGGSEYEFDFDN